MADFVCVKQSQHFSFGFGEWRMIIRDFGGYIGSCKYLLLGHFFYLWFFKICFMGFLFLSLKNKVFCWTFFFPWSWSWAFKKKKGGWVHGYRVQICNVEVQNNFFLKKYYIYIYIYIKYTAALVLSSSWTSYHDNSD